MNSDEQLKQGLLLHVEMNRNFIDEKIYKQFGKQCTREDDIGTLDRKKMLKVIRFVFDFGKNEGMKPFYQKLEKNIDEFIKLEKQTKPKNEKGNVPMDLQNLVQLIIYCVNNSFQKPLPPQVIEPPKLVPQIENLPVQSPKKQPVSKVQSPKKQIPKKQQQVKKQEKKKPQITLLNPQLQAKVDKIRLVVKPIEPIKAAAKVSTRLQIDKIPLPKAQFKLQKYQMPNLNVGPKYMLSLSQKPKIEPQPQPAPVYEPLSLSFLKNQNNRKLMRQRLFKIYQFCCSQQQNKGNSATFDKIKSEMEHMNLGKFLIFCKNTDLFKGCQKIDRNHLSATFKRIASGKKEINFDEFETLIKQVDLVFIEQKTKSEDKQNIPTYQSRLRLNSNQGYKEAIKLMNIVFSKEKKQDSLSQRKSVKSEHRYLTRHSGKFQTDLYQHVAKVKNINRTIDVKDGGNKIRKQHSQLDKVPKNSRTKPKALNLNEINMKEWPKITWLQEQIQKQDNNQLNDILPKIARRKDIIGNMRKRVQQVSRLQENR